MLLSRSLFQSLNLYSLLTDNTPFSLQESIPFSESFTSMTAPLLLMSTGSSANQEMARNQAPPTRHDLAPRTMVRGRRGATKPPAPKRPPQRGLGVAQLERLRQQEHWKNMAQMAQHLRGEFQIQSQLLSPPLGGAPLQYFPAGYCMASQPPVAFSDQMLGAGQGLAVQRVGECPCRLDRVVGSLYKAGVGGSASALKPSRELSSMPNVRCFPDRRDICVEGNKTINAARNVLVLDHGVGDRISSQERPVMNGSDFLALKLGNSFSSARNFTSRYERYGPHGGHQDVEVMGKGRKVNAAAGPGGDSLLTEYEFFPVPGRRKSNSNGRITSPKELSFPAAEDGESASAFAVNSDSGGGGGEASNKELNSNIDLSLRLSY